MSRTTTSRRRALCALLGCAAVTGLAACGTADDSSAAATTLTGDAVTLRVNWWGGDDRQERTEKAIELFEEEYPNITVSGEYSDWDGYWDKLATSTAGGNSPDVIQMDQMYLASYADRGTLLDLETQPLLDTSSESEAVLGTGRVSGTLYAMPISTTTTAVLVNEGVIDSLGLTMPDTGSWTWDEYQDFAVQVAQASGGTVIGTGISAVEYNVEVYARANGQAVFTDGEISIPQDTLAGFFQEQLDLSRSGGSMTASEYSEAASLSLDQSALATGKQAMGLAYVTQIPSYEAALGDGSLTAVPMPAEGDADGYLYLKPGMYWSVSSQSEHPAEAAAFIDFMLSDDGAVAALGVERGIPAADAARATLAGQVEDSEQQAIDYVDGVSDQLGEAPDIVPNGASEFDTILSRYLLEVLFERQTPQEAASGFLTELQASLDAAQ